MRFVRAATEGAVELGIYPDKAKEWFLHTMHGAVELLNATGANPESEIDKVTTPGGLTIRGLNAMEEKGFTAAVVNGLRTSVKH
jgi:pyrroline-5-carboxylate reductase